MSETGVAKEIERKFLLTSLPGRALASYHHTIHHAWIPGEVIHERISWISRNGGEYWRAIKAGHGIERIEAQEKISPESYGKFIGLCKKFIKKVRYLVKEEEGLVWEIDYFTDRVELVMAEVEMPRIDYPLVIPAWLSPHIAKEVTEDPSYLNINLATESWLAT